jgi:hypothetical protein
MIREIRMYFRLRTYISDLRKECHMKLSLNVVVQILGTVVQALNAIGGMFPAKQQVLIASIVGVIQAVVGLLAHFSNPDGTPAAAPYIRG